MSKTRSSRKLIPVLAGLVAIGLVSAGCAGEPSPGSHTGDEQGREIKLTIGAGHPADSGNVYVDQAKDFFVPELIRRVAEETAHTVSVIEAYGGVLAPHAETFESVRDGVLDIGMIMYPFESDNLPLENTSYAVPFGSPDPAVILGAWLDVVEKNPSIAKRTQDQFKQTSLAYIPYSNYGLLTTFPIRSLDDLKGKKIAAAGPNLPWLQAVGAVPVQGSSSEWYTSLQTGVVDGMITIPSTVAGGSLFEVADYWTAVDFGSVMVGSLNINASFAADLPDDVRAILEELAAEYQDLVVENTISDMKTSLALMEDNGVELVDLPESLRNAWIDLLPELPSAHAQESEQKGLDGFAVLNDYLDALDAEGYTHPRDWKRE